MWRVPRESSSFDSARSDGGVVEGRQGTNASSTSDVGLSEIPAIPGQLSQLPQSPQRLQLPFRGAYQTSGPEKTG